jgi:hypothetical protein
LDSVGADWHAGVRTDYSKVQDKPESHGWCRGDSPIEGDDEKEQKVRSYEDDRGFTARREQRKARDGSRLQCEADDSESPPMEMKRLERS